MIVIYYNTSDNLFVKKYDGDEFELIAAEQAFTDGTKKVIYSFTLKTDLGQVINIAMPIKFREDENCSKDISNLNGFAIASKSRTVLFNKVNSKDKDKDVFQDFRLLSDKTVYENVAFAMRVVEASPKEIRRRVPMVLSLVGLSHKYKMFPNELSGGEQQRVSLARALVNNPSVLIADEPTGNLDPDTAMEIMELLDDINKSGTTILMATHAKEIVDYMKKRVIAIEKGEIVRDEKRGKYEDEN